LAFEAEISKSLNEIQKSLKAIENVQVCNWESLEHLVFDGKVNVDILNGSTIFDATIEEFDPHIGMIIKESEHPNQTKSNYLQFIPMTAIAKLWRKPGSDKCVQTPKEKA
jgi:hypothetical protein